MGEGVRRWLASPKARLLVSLSSKSSIGSWTAGDHVDSGKNEGGLSSKVSVSSSSSSSKHGGRLLRCLNVSTRTLFLVLFD